MIFISKDKLKRIDAGFTLVEVMMVLAIFSIISIAAFSLIINYFRTSDLLSVQMTLQTAGKSALNQMVSDLRRANKSSIGSPTIYSASATSFIFYSNIDTDSYFEKVEYSVIGTELQKSVTKPSGNPLVYDTDNRTTAVLTNKIANGVTPIFNYYNGDYSGTEAALSSPIDITAVRFVKINLILDDNPAAPVSSLNMTASVALRNLKNN